MNFLFLTTDECHLSYGEILAAVIIGLIVGLYLTRKR
jgi:hypothetical protein